MMKIIEVSIVCHGSFDIEVPDDADYEDILSRIHARATFDVYNPPKVIHSFGAAPHTLEVDDVVLTESA